MLQILKSHTTRISANKFYCIVCSSTQPSTTHPTLSLYSYMLHANTRISPFLLRQSIRAHLFQPCYVGWSLPTEISGSAPPPKCTRHGMVLANRFRLSLATQPPHCCTPPGLDGITPSVCAPFSPTHQTYPHYSHPVDHVYIHI